MQSEWEERSTQAFTSLDKRKKETSDGLLCFPLLSCMTVAAEVAEKKTVASPEHFKQEPKTQNTKPKGFTNMVGYDLSNERKPAWIDGLLGEKFFVSCNVHEFARKNEKNIYCLDCCKSICPHCVQAHITHRLLQVRRYVYHDVIRLDDLLKLIDCSYVQPYTINSAKVVFLNQRPQSRPFKGTGNMCATCERILQEPYYYCSLGCKVEHIVKEGRDINRYLHKCETLSLSDFVFTHIESAKGDMNGDLEDGQMTPHSILDNPLSSGSSASGTVGCRTLACTATTDYDYPRRSTNRNVHALALHNRGILTVAEPAVAFSRRKGTPQRSPLY